MPHPNPCPTCKRIVAAHKRGITGRNDIAAKIGVSPATVTNHAPHAGVTFDRTATRAAVAAHQVDLRARRTVAMERMMARVEKNQDRLDAPYRYRLILSGGAEEGARTETVTDDDPPSVDEKNHMQVVTGYLAAITRLEQIDGAPGITKTASIITRVAEAFGISDA